jgi:hypothetical protein
MHHFSLTYTLEIGTEGLILFQKNAPDLMKSGATYTVNGTNVVQIVKNHMKNVGKLTEQ